jgi:hypothetical protein
MISAYVCVSSKSARRAVESLTDYAWATKTWDCKSLMSGCKVVSVLRRLSALFERAGFRFALVVHQPSSNFFFGHQTFFFLVTPTTLHHPLRSLLAGTYWRGIEEVRSIVLIIALANTRETVLAMLTAAPLPLLAARAVRGTSTRALQIG